MTKQGINTHGPIVVLGMHKSGTTLISETIHCSGFPMIESEAEGGYDDGNKMERAQIRTLNTKLLGDGGKQSLRVTCRLDPSSPLTEHIESARALVAAQDGMPWGFKDPRTLLTFDFWQNVLETPVLIGVFRDPVEVFGHYLRRAGKRWFSRDPAYLPDALRAWCIYNQHLLDLKQRCPDMLLLDYGKFMTTDDGMERLSAHLGRTLVDCRKPELRRAAVRSGVDYRLARLIVGLRDALDVDQIHRQLILAASK